MQDKIHPEYRTVIFHDIGADFKFLTRSTMNSKEKIKWEDGNTYPLITVDISAASHPFYTGKMKYIDAAGRVERFQKKYGWKAREEEEQPEAAAETK